MAAPAITEDQQIAAVREFNRFYTARLGLLRKRYLDGDFSLTEARILYEIGARPGLTATSLRRALGLNAGYISRILSLLTRRRLVRQLASGRDGREKMLTLSPAGASAVSNLNEQSAAQIRGLLANVRPADRDSLIASLAGIRRILSESELGEPGLRPDLHIARISEPTPDALQLLDEYYEAVRVVQRDTPETIWRIAADPCSGLWLAYLEQEAVGCVVLKSLASIPFAGECKRLYVRPPARGHGIASLLLDAQEDFARVSGLQWIYLDSYDDLTAAIALYRKRGYLPCERYNDNPQATVFLRKFIGQEL